MFVLCLLIACAIHANAHGRNESVRAVKDYVLNAGVYKMPVERRLFNFRRNGVKIDVKVVPSIKDESSGDKNDDYFPEFPVKDIGKCIVEFSLGCVRKRFVRYLETVGHLDEITLLGQDVKLVRSRIARFDGRAARNDSDISIERSVDDLFDSFTLRITLPRWNSKRERNQIDVMLDETAVTEGRGKKGGGGGGKGGKCKMMMMGMLMMIKMKLMGVAAMKGLMVGSMSLMVSMMMLMQKFGKGGGGGPWQSGGGGPWQSGGGGQLKEIVLVTKSSGGGGGGGCCGGGGGGGGGDSYGAPPPSSYGPPSGGGYGGGGGWGRSFRRQSMTLSRDKAIRTETANEADPVPAIGEVITNGESIDYPDYQELPMITTSNATAANWNATYDVREKEAANSSNSIKHSPSKVNTKGRSFVFNGGPPTGIVDGVREDVDSVSSANKPDMDQEKNILDSTYTDEWQATAEKISSITEALLGSNARPESPRDSRVKDIPLLRDV